MAAAQGLRPKFRQAVHPARAKQAALRYKATLALCPEFYHRVWDRPEPPCLCSCVPLLECRTTLCELGSRKVCPTGERFNVTHQKAVLIFIITHDLDRQRVGRNRN